MTEESTDVTFTDVKASDVEKTHTENIDVKSAEKKRVKEQRENDMSTKEKRENEKISMNKMGSQPIPKVMLNMGIPMILSMVLQACYNIVDAITPVVSFNYGMESQKRVKDGIKYGIIYITIIMVIGTFVDWINEICTKGNM